MEANDEFEMQLKSKEKFRNLKEKYQVKKNKYRDDVVASSPSPRKCDETTPKQLESAEQ